MIRKIRNLLMLLVVVALLGACGQRAQQHDTKGIFDDVEVLSKDEKAFMEKLASLCGNTYGGQQTFIQEGRESWAHKSFVMHVTVCHQDSILVPFHLDEDRSRTWMFIVEDDGLRFRHDHSYEDGSPHDVTLYGGYADGAGTGFKQHFPADDYTCEYYPTSCNATWTVELSPDLNFFTYRLYNFNELIFEAEFDLRIPLNQ
jgi:hypothetical protein